MAITVYHKKGRKPVYLVCGRVGPLNIMDKSFPYTEEGRIKAEEYWKRVRDLQALYYTLRANKFYKGNDGSINGLRVVKRKGRGLNGKVSYGLRASVTSDGVKRVRQQSFTDKRSLAVAFDELVLFIKEVRGIGAQDWVPIKKGLAKSYHYYNQCYNELKDEG